MIDRRAAISDRRAPTKGGLLRGTNAIGVAGPKPASLSSASIWSATDLR